MSIRRWEFDSPWHRQYFFHADAVRLTGLVATQLKIVVRLHSACPCCEGRVVAQGGKWPTCYGRPLPFCFEGFALGLPRTLCIGASPQTPRTLSWFGFSRFALQTMGGSAYADPPTTTRRPVGLSPSGFLRTTIHIFLWAVSIAAMHLTFNQGSKARLLGGSFCFEGFALVLPRTLSWFVHSRVALGERARIGCADCIRAPPLGVRSGVALRFG